MKFSFFPILGLLVLKTFFSFETSAHAEPCEPDTPCDAIQKAHESDDASCLKLKNNRALCSAIRTAVRGDTCSIYKNESILMNVCLGYKETKSQPPCSNINLDYVKTRRTTLDVLDFCKAFQIGKTVATVTTDELLSEAANSCNQIVTESQTPGLLEILKTYCKSQFQVTHPSWNSQWVPPRVSIPIAPEAMKDAAYSEKGYHHRLMKFRDKEMDLIVKKTPGQYGFIEIHLPAISIEKFERNPKGFDRATSCLSYEIPYESYGKENPYHYAHGELKGLLVRTDKGCDQNFRTNGQYTAVTGGVLLKITDEIAKAFDVKDTGLNDYSTKVFEGCGEKEIPLGPVYFFLYGNTWYEKNGYIRQFRNKEEESDYLEKRQIFDTFRMTSVVASFLDLESPSASTQEEDTRLQIQEKLAKSEDTFVPEPDTSRSTRWSSEQIRTYFDQLDLRNRYQTKPLFREYFKNLGTSPSKSENKSQVTSEQAMRDTQAGSLSHFFQWLWKNDCSQFRYAYGAIFPLDPKTTTGKTLQSLNFTMFPKSALYLKPTLSTKDGR